MVMVMALIIIVVVGLSVYGVWGMWRRKQQSVISYKPVGAAAPEQELQPL